MTSRENPLIKQVSKLQTSARARREDGLFALEGLRICADARDNGIRFETLIVSETAAVHDASAVARFAENAERRVLVPDALFAKIGDTDSPQGILALVRLPDGQGTPDPAGRYLGLENIADPANLGAAARTAEALGLSGILLTSSGCDPYSPKALRASMGTLLRVPLFLTGDLCALAEQAGLRTVACVVDRDALPITDVRFQNGDLLLIGNEANGLTADTRQNADLRITIPMRGRAESLNAAAAAAIALWEMMRGTR